MYKGIETEDLFTLTSWFNSNVKIMAVEELLSHHPDPWPGQTNCHLSLPAEMFKPTATLNELFKDPHSTIKGLHFNS